MSQKLAMSKTGISTTIFSKNSHNTETTSLHNWFLQGRKSQWFKKGEQDFPHTKTSIITTNTMSHMG